MTDKRERGDESEALRLLLYFEQNGAEYLKKEKKDKRAEAVVTDWHQTVS